jgi:flagellar hook assembly protein FlgD
MESSITQLINYPNPFSTSTRFVFTLTGSEVPENIFIKIMTITGKVVKEITQEELGLINIGRNITEYEWDGTDKYGDKLANGVYLYKVQVRHNGSNFKQREVQISTSGESSTLSSKYFKNGLGKMYILR